MELAPHAKCEFLEIRHIFLVFDVLVHEFLVQGNFIQTTGVRRRWCMVQTQLIAVWWKRPSIQNFYRRAETRNCYFFHLFFLSLFISNVHHVIFIIHKCIFYVLVSFYKHVCFIKLIVFYRKVVNFIIICIPNIIAN